MSPSITTFEQFKDRWDGVHNFLMGGDAFRFHWSPPPLEQCVDELRRHPAARVTRGMRGGALDRTPLTDEARSAPLEQMMAQPFALAIFEWADLLQPGRLMAGLQEHVMEPWQQALRNHGFTWTRCYPIIFISGRGCATNYHMDFSHVLAWQIYGAKRFMSFRDPQRWAPSAVRKRFSQEYANYADWYTKPSEATDGDVEVIHMRPGDVLWNAFLTPHWVEAGDDQVAMSINISHGGLRLDGRLCPHEAEYLGWKGPG